MILKERDLHVPEEELVTTTDKLKEMIAELLDIRSEELNLQRIRDTLQKKEVEQQEEKPRKKPMFSIKEMQREHRERQQRARKKNKY